MTSTKIHQPLLGEMRLAQAIAKGDKHAAGLQCLLDWFENRQDPQRSLQIRTEWRSILVIFPEYTDDIVKLLMKDQNSTLTSLQADFLVTFEPFVKGTLFDFDLHVTSSNCLAVPHLVIAEVLRYGSEAPRWIREMAKKLVATDPRLAPLLGVKETDTERGLQFRAFESRFPGGLREVQTMKLTVLLTFKGLFTSAPGQGPVQKLQIRTALMVGEYLIGQGALVFDNSLATQVRLRDPVPFSYYELDPQYCTVATVSAQATKRSKKARN